jgi:chemotaxis protein methyltransferase CheR
MREAAGGAPPAAAPPDDGALTERDFERFRRLAREQAGIALGPHKRPLLRARLDRRLRALGLGSFRAYHAYLTDGRHPEELERFVNALTTNKTAFFREPHHFAFLGGPWAAERQAAAARGGARRLRLWSAACSTGEEAYSLAIALMEARLGPPGWDLRILASDIDTEVLAQAREGVYPAERLVPVPAALRARYFLWRRGTADRVRVRPELGALLTWRRINLADPVWPVRGPLDAILCRNTLIYFDRPTQQALLARFHRLLRPDGVLLLGHSESIIGLSRSFLSLGGTVYRRLAEPVEPSP